MIQTFYFHDVLQSTNYSKDQVKELESSTHFDLFKNTMKPFETAKDLKVILLINAEGIDFHPDEVDYIKEHPDWIVGCHGLHHDDYSKKTRLKIFLELSFSKKKIEDTFNQKVTIFVPPWLKFNDDVKSVCDELGMKIEIENYFSIKHMNIWHIHNTERFDVHHWLDCDRRKVNNFFKFKENNSGMLTLRHSSFVGEENINKGAKYWNGAWSRNYISGIKKHQPLYDEVRKYLNGKIVDLACGVTSLYKGGDYDVTGVDISSFAVSKSKEIYPKGNFFVGNLADTKLPSESFDTVVLTCIIEHFFDYTPVLKEAKRLAKIGGKIIISVPQHSFCDDHIYPVWTEESIEKYLGEYLGKLSYYKLQKWWIIIYEKT